MKNSTIAAIVILLVTIVFLFVVNDLSKTKHPAVQANVHKIQ
ncbi:MAG TPA: hypothetical protein VNJ50_00330 [Gelidibacter sp.]|nr:hypothetical protein [Gelidibacter sp.]HXJ97265.1 hypothetical protein [Gelidibacter sp.]